MFPFIFASMATVPLPPPGPCVVSQQDALNQFEAPFADPVSRTKMTRTFFLYEPVLYQPSHLAQPILTHISSIAKDFFVVAASTTDRMVPISQAQKVLTFKLTLEDIEKELHGKSLNGGERLVWRRWLDNENKREGRRSRLRAPCCGRSTFRYKLVPDERGFLSCKHCTNAYADALYASYDAQCMHYSYDSEKTSNQEGSPVHGSEHVGQPPWRTQMPPAKRQRSVMSPEEVNDALLCTQ